MKIQSTALFSVTSWDEQTWEGKPAKEVQGEKFTLAKVGYAYAGVLTGESRFQYLMHYRADGTGTFTGIEHFKGNLEGREGEFVLAHEGTFDAASVKGTARVVSASGGLAGLHGGARVELAGHQSQYPLVLDLELG
ncbi:MAG: DUF3224 domain-containing protein [Spirochaetes bacterium]|nr:DUF3224 domain-containing protein [Spirochaetota bacterium]